MHVAVIEAEKVVIVVAVVKVHALIVAVCWYLNIASPLTRCK